MFAMNMMDVHETSLCTEIFIKGWNTGVMRRLFLLFALAFLSRSRLISEVHVLTRIIQRGSLLPASCRIAVVCTGQLTSKGGRCLLQSLRVSR